MSAAPLDRDVTPTAYTMKITQEESTSSITVKMQVMLYYGPEVLIDVDPDTAVYIPRPR